MRKLINRYFSSNDQEFQARIYAANIVIQMELKAKYLESVSPYPVD